MARITKKQAEALWDRLRDNLIDTDKVIVEIVETEAWKPLGFSSFVAAWNERLAGVRLATEACKAAVVYRMIQDGLSDVDIAMKIRGVGPEMVEQVRSKSDTGLLPGQMRFRRRGTTCLPPSRPYRIEIELDVETRARYAALAEERGSTIAAEAEGAIHAWFAALETAERSVA